MKRIFYRFLILFFIAFSVDLFSQEGEPPPDPGSLPSQGGGSYVGGNPPGGGGAPLGEGVLLLISLAAGWGGKKVFDARNKFGE